MLPLSRQRESLAANPVLRRSSPHAAQGRIAVVPPISGAEGEKGSALFVSYHSPRPGERFSFCSEAWRLITPGLARFLTSVLPRICGSLHTTAAALSLTVPSHQTDPDARPPFGRTAAVLLPGRPGPLLDPVIDAFSFWMTKRDLDTFFQACMARAMAITP